LIVHKIIIKGCDNYGNEERLNYKIEVIEAIKEVKKIVVSSDFVKRYKLLFALILATIIMSEVVIVSIQMINSVNQNTYNNSKGV